MRSYLKGKHKGKHRYRFKNNPEEKRFANKWQGMCNNGLLEQLLGDGQNIAEDVTKRDAMVAASAIQWLGSPVGQHFLAELGYKKTGQ